MSTSEFSFNDEVPGLSNTKTYKPSPQITAAFGPDRVSFLNWPDLMDPNFGTAHMKGKSPKFVGGPRIFLRGPGYVSPRFSADAAKKTAEEGELIAMYMQDDPTADASKAITMKAATLIVLFREGKPPEVLPWLLPPTHFNEIRTKNQRQPLWSHDILVTATQKGNFVDSKLEAISGCELYDILLKKEAGDPAATAKAGAILARARELLPNLALEVGKDLTIDQIKQRRGQGRAQGAPEGAAPAAAVSADVASLVSGILDG